MDVQQHLTTLYDKLDGRDFAYLEERGICAEQAERYGIRSVEPRAWRAVLRDLDQGARHAIGVVNSKGNPHPHYRDTFLVVPMREPGGEIVGLRFIATSQRDRETAKVLSAATAMRAPFGVSEVKPGRVYLFEGETDVLSAATIGVQAVGLPGNALKAEWVPMLDAATDLVVCIEPGAGGDAMRRSVLRALLDVHGLRWVKDRVTVRQWAEGDANDALQGGTLAEDLANASPRLMPPIRVNKAALKRWGIEGEWYDPKPLATIREELPEAIEKAADMPGIHVFHAPPAVGKTTAARQALATRNHAGKAVHVQTDTRDNRDEWVRAMREVQHDLFPDDRGQAEIRAIETRHQGNCTEWEGYALAASKHASGGKVFCEACDLYRDDACAYWRDRTSGGDSVVVTHELGLRADVGHGADIAVIDEDIVKTAMQSATLTLTDALRLLRLDSEQSAELRALVESTQLEEGKPQVTVGAEEIGAVLEGVEINEEAPEILGTAFACAYQAEDPIAAMKALPDWHAIEALRQSQANGWRCIIARRGRLELQHYRRPEIVDHATSTLILDATADPRVYDAMFGADRVHHYEWDQERPEYATVTHVPGSLCKRDWRGGTWHRDISGDRFAALAAEYDAEDTLWVVHKAWADAGITEGLRGHVEWFNGTKARGTNAYQHCSTVVVLTYRVPHHAVENLADCIAAQAGEAVMHTHRDAARHLLEVAPTLQPAHRGRIGLADEDNRKHLVIVQPECPSNYGPFYTPDRTVDVDVLAARHGIAMHGNKAALTVIRGMIEEEGENFVRLQFRETVNLAEKRNPERLKAMQRNHTSVQEDNYWTISRLRCIAAKASECGLEGWHVTTSEGGHGWWVFAIPGTSRRRVADVLARRHGLQWCDVDGERYEYHADELRNLMRDTLTTLRLQGIEATDIIAMSKTKTAKAIADVGGVSKRTADKRIEDFGGLDAVRTYWQTLTQASHHNTDDPDSVPDIGSPGWDSWCGDVLMSLLPILGSHPMAASWPPHTTVAPTWADAIEYEWWHGDTWNGVSAAGRIMEADAQTVEEWEAEGLPF